MAEVILKNLTKRWGDFVGVDDQSLHIADKEFLVLLGPSGCGKTTTMRMIAGLEDPTEGEVWIGNRMVNDDLPKDRDVAMVFQNYGLYPHMTIHDNIAYPLKVRGAPKSEIAPRVKRAAEQVELTQFLDRKPKALSGGQRQRVALARAIVRTPKLFLMDEPLSNLDAKLRVTMRAELKHLSRELKITTVYVTHDQIEAMTLADRVAVMKNGAIQQLGTPDEIYNDPANLFVAGFIGSPAMNLIDGSVQSGMFVTTGGTRLVGVSAPDRDAVVLGVRADDMRVSEPGQGDIDVRIYAFENTGEATLLTVQWGRQRVIAKGDRHLRKDQDDMVSISLNPNHLYLFDPATGERRNAPKTTPRSARSSRARWPTFRHAAMRRCAI
ncbi:MAG: sn-glycerol-3-phosphate ABC transporter ATP-binding protein UgpC [Pseudomonadota bacterium]